MAIKTIAKWKLFFILLIGCVLTALLMAEENEEGFRASTNLEVQISSRPEARLRLGQSFIFPFLQGSNPLTRGNNIKTTITADVTPVSLAGIGEIVWTPVAFLLLSGGGQAGSGWNMPLGDGIGLKKPENDIAPGPGDPPRDMKVVGDNFDGLIWKAWGGGTFQFDLGAVIPGDWTHVVFQTSHKFIYSAYTRAGPCDFWFFENDDGENMNGWKYAAMFLLGYQMPLSPVLDTIGLMAELEKPLYNAEGGDLWGANLGNWIFSGIFRLSFSPRFNTNLAFQMRTRRNYGTGYFEYKDRYNPDYRLTDEKGEIRIVFYRVAMILEYKLW
jgi:hypothetical protein